MKNSIKAVAVCGLVVGAFCFGKAVAEFPELNAAKKNLLEAKNHLNAAASDFGGHRVKALESVEKAVKEVDEAILYADKH